ncbi:MAG: ATP-grasp domain-containing protein [Crocinitomicaceae bacterium]|nr:ATP-grasp domain-containing protein [Crocinitomicaceae bacterium]
MKILITSLGSNTAIGVIKSLKLAFQSVTIVACDTNSQSECNGSLFPDYFEQVCHADENNYIPSIKGLIKKYNIDCLIPIHDREIEIIAKNKFLLSGKTKIIVNNSDIIELCNDKRKCSYFLKEILTTPKIFEEINEVKLPAIMKEIKGVGSKKIKIIDSQNAIPNNIPEDFMIQELISGIEYTVDCFSSYFSNDFRCAVRKRKEVKNGMSIKGEIISHPKIEKLCEKIHQTIKYKGVSNIQFIENEKGIYFIEINPRFAGGGILTYKNGFNIPVIAINELIMNKIFEPVKDYNPIIGTKMVRYLQETFFDKDGNRI